MEELVQRVSAAAGLDPETATKAVGLILGFLKKEGPQLETEQLISAMPGADALITRMEGGSGGLLRFLGGGGLMALAGQLTSAGLGMGQMQAVGKELFAYARETGGEDLVGTIAGSIPGLGQFV